jgi:hypothetical protein
VKDSADLVASLLANQPFPEGIDPRGARDALYVSMTELVLRRAGTRAVWRSWSRTRSGRTPESIAWLDHLLGRATGRPLFLLLIVRPAFWREHPQRFTGRDHVRVELRPMARKATREIARAVIGEACDDAMLDQVAQQAAGSPLFAQELARVIASGKDATRAPTIEAAIQVSLDALDDAAREAVVRASVFGISVWDQGLAAVGVTDPAAALKKLIGRRCSWSTRRAGSPARASTSSSTPSCATSRTPRQGRSCGGACTRSRRAGSTRWARTRPPSRSTSISATSTRRPRTTGRSRRAAPSRRTRCGTR